MLINILIFGIMAMAFFMIAAKRISALINGFCIQSFFLFLLTFYSGLLNKNSEFHILAILVLLIKVIFIPAILKKTNNKINLGEETGFYINPTVSIIISLLLVYLSYLFVLSVLDIKGHFENAAMIIAVSVGLMGLLILIFRKKALCQVIGLLVIENGIFLASTTITGGMPFFVEIAIGFDILIVVLITVVFIHRINVLFEHMDVNKLNNLRG